MTLPAGSVTAPPFRLQVGTTATAVVLGAVEFDGDQLYLTGNAGNPTRRALAYADAQASSIELSNLTAAPLKPVVAKARRLSPPCPPCRPSLPVSPIALLLCWAEEPCSLGEPMAVAKRR